MKHTRNNFVDFNNRDVCEEGRKSLKRKIKRRKFIRNISVFTFIAFICLILSVYFRPDLFSLFSFSKISQNISSLFPDQPEKMATLFKQNASFPAMSSKTNYPEYHFTKEQVEKVKGKMLNKKDDPEMVSAYIRKIIEKNKDGKFQYEIELLSGRRIYSQSASLKQNIISFGDEKGLYIALDIKDIKSINLLRKPTENGQ